MYSKLAFDTTFREKARKLIASGNFRVNQDGKLSPYDPKGVIHSPWVFTNYDARRKFCSLWNAIYCSEFQLIPRFCRFNCWKTVVYPRNVLETFHLADLFKTLNLPSKCGADRRNYTHHAWGGYIYGDSLEQGREYYSIVRRAVTEVISEKVDVILKRGCTEMERLRPSNTWDDYSQEEKILEFQLDDLFSLNEIYFYQSAWMVRDIKESWVLRAIEIGDQTVEETLTQYSLGIKLSDLTVNSVTYHDKE